MRRARSFVTALCLFTLIGATSGCGISPEDDADAITEPAENGKGDASGYKVSLTAPRSLAAGRAATLRFKVKNPSGDLVTDFETEHTKLYHLIVVSRDLSYFTHLHPTHDGEGGFSVRWTPPGEADSYYLYSQFRPDGVEETLLTRTTLAVPGTTRHVAVPLVADADLSKTVGANLVMMEAPTAGFRVGTQRLSFMVHDGATGDLADDLEPFLGAKAHMIAIKGGASGRVFSHYHDMGADAGGGGHGGHGGSEGVDPSGTLGFDASFPSAGLYRVWVQFRRAGRDVKASFTMQVGGGTTDDTWTPLVGAWIAYSAANSMYGLVFEPAISGDGHRYFGTTLRQGCGVSAACAETRQEGSFIVTGDRLVLRPSGAPQQAYNLSFGPGQLYLVRESDEVNEVYFHVGNGGGYCQTAADCTRQVDSGIVPQCAGHLTCGGQVGRCSCTN